MSLKCELLLLLLILLWLLMVVLLLLVLVSKHDVAGVVTPGTQYLVISVFCPNKKETIEFNLNHPDLNYPISGMSLNEHI